MSSRQLLSQTAECITKTDVLRRHMQYTENIKNMKLQ